MLQSKHREHSYVRNEIGKKLHTTIMEKNLKVIH